MVDDGSISFWLTRDTVSNIVSVLKSSGVAGEGAIGIAFA